MIVSTANRNNTHTRVCLINTKSQTPNEKDERERNVLLTQFDALLLLNTSLKTRGSMPNSIPRFIASAVATFTIPLK